MANVIFKRGTKEQFDAIATKDPNTLYWLKDVQEVWVGDKCFGVGREATDALAGLLSPEDKATLETLASGELNLKAADSTVVISKLEDGSTTIGLNISAMEDNAVSLEADGIFVPVPVIPVAPEYVIEKQDEAAEGYAATYRLKRTQGDEIAYVGDAINLPKDLVLQSGTFETVGIANQPYAGAQVGDPYIDLVINDAESTHIYVPVKGLVDIYLPGKGVEIVDQTVGVKIDEANANGLFVAEDGVGLSLATSENAGAMSAVDKVFLDSIPETYVTQKRLSEAVGTPNAEQFTVADGVLTLSDIDADKVIYDGQRLSDVLNGLMNTITWEDLPTVMTLDLAADDPVSVITAAEDWTVLQMNDGTISTAMVLQNTVTFEGTNAGVAQNFAQEAA